MKQQATLLLPCLLTGGTEVATLDTAKALTELGYLVTAVVYFDEIDPAMVANFSKAGIQVQLLGLPRGCGLAATLMLVQRLAGTLWRQRPSLVWVQYMTPSLIPLLVARFFTRRLVAAVHVATRHYSPGGLGRLRWLASWWCHKLVCVSHSTANGVLGDRPSSRLHRHVRVIPNALDMTAAGNAPPRNWRQELGIPNGNRIIGYVGRLAHNKGVDVLLNAAEVVNQRFPDTHWIVIGDGPEMLSLQRLATECGMAVKIIFLGNLPRKSVYSALKGFDIAVVPSREEGFGLTSLESMACGVPLVASRVDALQEVVLDGTTGLLFKPEDAQDLAAKLTTLLQDTKLQRQLANAAVVRARGEYDRSAYQSKLTALLGELN